MLALNVCLHVSVMQIQNCSQSVGIDKEALVSEINTTLYKHSVARPDNDLVSLDIYVGLVTYRENSTMYREEEVCLCVYLDQSRASCVPKL